MTNIAPIEQSVSVLEFCKDLKIGVTPFPSIGLRRRTTTTMGGGSEHPACGPPASFSVPPVGSVTTD